MKKYRIGYTKTVTGSFLIEAETPEEAKQKLLEGEFLSEDDYKSNYDYDKIPELA